MFVCRWSKRSDRGLHRPLQICNIVKLPASQNLLKCGEQEEITGGQIRAVRRMTKHFNEPSVDRFLSRRSTMARGIVMMKQHGRQQGSSFLPHGSKEVSVLHMLVRNVNHSKRSTKHHTQGAEVTGQLRVNGKLRHLRCCTLEDQSLALKRKHRVHKYVNTAAVCVSVVNLPIVA